MRGLSDEAFREFLRAPRSSPVAALVRLRWPDRLRLPLQRPSGALRAATSGSLSMQPVQEADIAHGGHDLPRDQAAADTLVRRHPPGRDGEERHLVGGTRPPSRGQAADGLCREASRSPRLIPRREGQTRLTGRVDDGRRLSRRSPVRQKTGPPERGGHDALSWSAVSTSPELRPRKLKLAPVKGDSNREVARGSKHLLARKHRRGGCDVRTGLLERTRRSRLQPPGDPHRVDSRQPSPQGIVQIGLNTNARQRSNCSITSTYRKLGPDHAGRYLASFAWRYNRRYSTPDNDPAFRP